MIFTISKGPFNSLIFTVSKGPFNMMIFTDSKGPFNIMIFTGSKGPFNIMIFTTSIGPFNIMIFTASKGPKFVERFKDVAVKADWHQMLFKAEVRESCSETDDHQCPCGKVVYAMESGGENFIIDRYNGEVEVKEDAVLADEEYTLVITAQHENGPPQNSDRMTASVHVLKNEPFGTMADGFGSDENEQHSRHKRVGSVWDIFKLN